MLQSGYMLGAGLDLAPNIGNDRIKHNAKEAQQ